MVTVITCSSKLQLRVRYGELSGHELEDEQVNYGIECAIFAKGSGIARLLALIYLVLVGTQ